MKGDSRYIRAVFLVLAGSAIFIACLLAFPLFRLPFSYFTIRLLRSMGLFAGCLMLLAGTWPLAGSGWWRKCWLLAAACMLTLTIVESTLSFLSFTVGNMHSLNERNWFARHWDINSLGIRDQTTAGPVRKSVPSLYILGDSFTAGHGIRSESDRFVNRMRERLSDCARVEIRAQNGLSLADQLEQTATLDARPGFVLYLHVPNDIEYLRPKADSLLFRSFEAEDVRLPSLPGIAHHKIGERSLLFKGSFLYNAFVLGWNRWISHVVERRLFNSEEERKQLDELVYPAVIYYVPALYFRSDILMAHYQKDLLRLKEICDERGLQLAVGLFPSLDSPNMLDDSDRTVNQAIATYYQSVGVPVINLSPAMRSLPVHQRTVNRFNSHPGPAAQPVIADSLSKFLVRTWHWEHCDQPR